ncbi:hypothetical protein DPMN_107253 [Dreissena polymorpha]|uniref:Uncharacterized protein n=1 Tax=Dreissena polymorpha TaxID=45954 RepID=A0A9D4K6T9_DREPO|nr:hypothetical protein DPMN_107253 [Dreissena polymorpha]
MTSWWLGSWEHSHSKIDPRTPWWLGSWDHSHTRDQSHDLLVARQLGTLPQWRSMPGPPSG